MSEEISLNDLIEQVKFDLFSAYTGTKSEGNVVYPVFFVDEVELELTVSIEYVKDVGIKVTIPQLVEGSVGAGDKVGTGHTVKLRLSPILTRQEMRDLIDNDERLMAGINKASVMALRRGTKLAGE